MTRVPVYRYKSIDDARRALWSDSDAPDLARRIRRLWAFAARLYPRRCRPGVRKFRTLEDARRDRLND